MRGWCGPSAPLSFSTPSFCAQRQTRQQQQRASDSQRTPAADTHEQQHIEHSTRGNELVLRLRQAAVSVQSLVVYARSNPAPPAAGKGRQKCSARVTGRDRRRWQPQWCPTQTDTTEQQYTGVNDESNRRTVEEQHTAQISTSCSCHCSRLLTGVAEAMAERGEKKVTREKVGYTRTAEQK